MNRPRHKTFAEFYPYYLKAHRRRGTRMLHFFGTGLGALCVLLALYQWRPLLAVIGVVLGYGFSWIGHFFIEHNRPETFRQPFFSFIADFRLFFELITGRQRF